MTLGHAEFHRYSVISKRKEVSSQQRTASRKQLLRGFWIDDEDPGV